MGNPYRSGPGTLARSYVERLEESARDATRDAVAVGPLDAVALRTYYAAFCAEFTERAAERLIQANVLRASSSV